MNKRILHILPDEKVVNSFINLMESVYPEDSDYFVYNFTDHLIKVDAFLPVTHFNIDSQDFVHHITDLTGYQVVCLHSICAHHSFANISHSNLIWIPWGADLYELLLKPKGYQLYLDNGEIYNARGKWVPKLIYKIVDYFREQISWRHAFAIVKNVKWVVGLDQDYKLLMDYYPDLTCQYLGNINYYPIEKLIGGIDSGEYCCGSSVFVNNAAAANGNHISVFKALVNTGAKVRVICPISYGILKFANYIEERGYSLFGDHFVPIKQFMSSKDYYHLFLQSNAFIFGHLRQCAFGNIMIALFYGGKCFFYKVNPVYSYLRENGFIVFNIEEDLSHDVLLEPLSEDWRKLNREKALTVCSQATTLCQIAKYFGEEIN